MKPWQRVRALLQCTFNAFSCFAVKPCGCIWQRALPHHHTLSSSHCHPPTAFLTSAAERATGVLCPAPLAAVADLPDRATFISAAFWRPKNTCLLSPTPLSVHRLTPTLRPPPARQQNKLAPTAVTCPRYTCTEGSPPPLSCSPFPTAMPRRCKTALAGWFPPCWLQRCHQGSGGAAACVGVRGAEKGAARSSSSRARGGRRQAGEAAPINGAPSLLPLLPGPAAESEGKRGG